jgi:low affinity Fe/Cu permease
VGIEHLTEQELEDSRKRCEERAKAAGGGPEPPLGADAPAEAKAEEALDTAARRARRAADELT